LCVPSTLHLRGRILTYMKLSVVKVQYLAGNLPLITELVSTQRITPPVSWRVHSLAHLLLGAFEHI
ncbi:hypothetical protein, partial [Umezakia ovalisporum]